MTTKASLITKIFFISIFFTPLNYSMDPHQTLITPKSTSMTSTTRTKRPSLKIETQLTQHKPLQHHIHTLKDVKVIKQFSLHDSDVEIVDPFPLRATKECCIQ